MLEQFLNHIKLNNLCKTTDKILLAVSGGVDSVVMFHLFRQARLDFAVAHCNFQLRGEASDGDEKWVEALCKENSIPFHSARFDTADYARQNGLSIQMAARQLRYTYFERLLKEEGYQKTATAHHANDNVETVVLQFIKGSGIGGLKGIPVKNDTVIRPMLFATRDDIEQYAKANAIGWREDLSNASDDYQRNIIRRRIIPVMKEINPALEHTFDTTLERITGAHHWVRNFIDQFTASHVSIAGEEMTIDISALRNSGAAATLLWELLKDKGFNFDQCREITAEHQPGKRFLSSGYSLHIDREVLIIRPAHGGSDMHILIETPMQPVVSTIGEIAMRVVNMEDFKLSADAGIAQVDFDLVQFPISWRNWRAGDAFIPLGMHGQKKVSDFLIDVKVSVPEKEKITVIESAGRILWVVGLRIHDHFKVTSKTGRVLILMFKKKQATTT